jgi:WD40 repeat protein
VVLRGHRGTVRAVAFSPDSARVASGGNDGSVRLWRVTGAGEPAVLNGHQGIVWSATFTPDGRSLLTGGNDGTIRLWNLGRLGESLVFHGFRASVESWAAAQDGRVLTAHDDGTVRQWRCPVRCPVEDVLTYADEHVTRRLTPEETKAYLEGPAT